MPLNIAVALSVAMWAGIWYALANLAVLGAVADALALVASAL